MSEILGSDLVAGSNRLAVLRASPLRDVVGAPIATGLGGRLFGRAVSGGHGVVVQVADGRTYEKAGGEGLVGLECTSSVYEHSRQPLTSLFVV